MDLQNYFLEVSALSLSLLIKNQNIPLYFYYILVEVMRQDTRICCTAMQK